MSSADPFEITWVDAGREPRVAPNPNYPDGIDIVAAAPMGARRCRVELPYPARRIGHYLIECRRCGTRVAVTTAGRPDDPRSATIGCRPRQQEGET
jgi:hypothetical protein